VEGDRENQLIAYGVVVGLNYSRARLDKAVVTSGIALIGTVARLGVNTRNQVAKLSAKNIAAGMVTAWVASVCRRDLAEAPPAATPREAAEHGAPEQALENKRLLERAIALQGRCLGGTG